MYEVRKVPLPHTYEETKTYITDAIRPIRGSLGGKKVIEASQKWILTAVFTLEGRKKGTHCCLTVERPSQGRGTKHSIA